VLSGQGGANIPRLRLSVKYLEHVPWKLATVIGDLDLIKMWLTPEETVRTPAIEAAVRAVLEAMRDAGVAMDVNARGLLKPSKCIYMATRSYR